MWFLWYYFRVQISLSRIDTKYQIEFMLDLITICPLMFDNAEKFPYSNFDIHFFLKFANQSIFCGFKVFYIAARKKKLFLLADTPTQNSMLSFLVTTARARTMICSSVSFILLRPKRQQILESPHPGRKRLALHQLSL